MSQRLSAKVAVVTGGTRGIGRAIAEAFLREGAAVTIVGTSEQGVEKALAEIGESERLDGIAADFAEDPTGAVVITKARERFGRLDVLVNNAGTGSFQDPFELTREEWDRVFTINLSAPFFLAREAARAMSERGGSIVNIASIAAHTGGVAGSPAYAASKAGLLGLTKSLARRFGELGVRVNAISPADIETDMTADWPQEIRDKLIAITPLGRFGTVDEVTGAAVFLASDEASYVTGQTLGVNGGAHME